MELKKQLIKYRLLLIILGIFILFISYPVYIFSKGFYYLHAAEKELHTPKKLHKAHLDIYGNIPVLHVYGTPEQIGEQYGQLLQGPFLALLSAAKMVLPGNFRQQYLNQAKVLEKNLPEDLRTELKAISRVTGIPYLELVVINITSELRCSSLSAWGKTTANKQMIIGRNLDYNISALSKIAGLITVYHFAKGETVVAINFIGLIGCFTGINSRGITFSNMLVFNETGPRFNRQGIPIQLLLREAAQNSASVPEFTNYLKNNKHVIPMNVMVADSKTAQVLEIGNGKLLTRKAKDNVNYLAATNYFRLAELRSYQKKCCRYNTFMKMAEKYSGKIDVDIMKTILNKTKIRDINLQAVIFEPDKMLMHVSMNSDNAADGPYTTFDVKKLIHDQGNPVIR